jgi:GTP cyclohydrolase I
MDESKVAYHFAQLVSEGLGFDLTDPNLSDTPLRVAKMYCREWFKSVDIEFKDFKSFPNDESYKQIIMSDRIHFTSICSHHFLPFTGLAWISYIPATQLVGASKMSRLVEHYASRPQLQENLTHQVLNCFVNNIQPEGAMVVMRAIHSCMTCRGVRQTGGAGMQTSALHGAFYKAEVKAEALELIKLSLIS